jgi:hypothetical protein
MDACHGAMMYLDMSTALCEKTYIQLAIIIISVIIITDMFWCQTNRQHSKLADLVKETLQVYMEDTKRKKVRFAEECNRPILIQFSDTLPRPEYVAICINSKEWKIAVDRDAAKVVATKTITLEPHFKIEIITVCVNVSSAPAGDERAPLIHFYRVNQQEQDSEYSNVSVDPGGCWFPCHEVCPSYVFIDAQEYIYS